MGLRTWLTGVATLAAMLAAALPVTAQVSVDAVGVRVVVASFRQELSQVETYASFREAVLEHFETHVDPLLGDEGPALVVYPERLDRLAMLIGMRGLAAREELANGAEPGAARAALYGPYAPQIAYYRARYDGLAETQYLQLALTDTVVRGVVEAFQEAARAAGVHVVFGAALPEYTVASGPDEAVVTDPEVGGGSGYVATSASVWPQSVVVGPDGQIVGQQRRLWLDIEEELPSVTSEGLAAGTHADVDVVRLPFARIGLVAGDDASSPAVVSRLDQLGAQLLVQPLSGGPWANLPTAPSFWAPDAYLRGPGAQPARYPNVRAIATSVLTGNLGARVFDGQPAVVIDTPDVPGAGCFVGSGAVRGAVVGGWTDLGLTEAESCGVANREALAEIARGLAPGSGGDQENAYAHGAAATDVVLAQALSPSADRLRTGTFEPSVAVGEATEQLWPAVVADPNSATLAWVDGSAVRSQVVTATWDGSNWSDPVPAVRGGSTLGRGRTNDQGEPAVTSLAGLDHPRSDGLSVEPAVGAFVLAPRVDEFDRDVYAAQHDPTLDRWEPAVRVDRPRSSPPDRADAFRLHGDVELAASPDGTLVAAWSDLRWPYTEPQIRIARSLAGDGWRDRQRVSGGPPDPDLESGGQPVAKAPGETRGQVSPTAAFTGRGDLLVAWQEPSESGVPGISLARSPDGGTTFEAPRSFAELDAAGFRPVLATAGDHVWLAWERATADGGRRIVVARSADAGYTWSSPVALDPGGSPPSRQGPAAAVAHGEMATFVYEDDRAGDSDVLAIAIDADGTASHAQRVDDGPPGAAAHAPDVTRLADGRVLVVWQDEREDEARIRTSLAAGPWPPAAAGSDGQPAPDDQPASVDLPTTGGGATAPALLGIASAILLSSFPARPHRARRSCRGRLMP